MDFLLHPIGYVRSPLSDVRDCPHQGKEGAPEAWIDVDEAYAEALDGIRVGSEIVVLTWMHLADRSVLRVHPRRDKTRPLTGVFFTRSPHRPNPIGLHKVTVSAVESGTRLLVTPLEAVDGTPVVDIKSALPEDYGL
jgi:tRNA-Thr(GGU) m(6)t(6)A37 methyltransferase TsaA